MLCLEQNMLLNYTIYKIGFIFITNIFLLFYNAILFRNTNLMSENSIYQKKDKY